MVSAKTKDLLLSSLLPFFKRRSKFVVRWKATWRKDYIGKAVYQDEFLEEFTRKDLKTFSDQKLIKKTTYLDPKTGSWRACVILIAKHEPQRNFWKRLFIGEMFNEKFIKKTVYFFLAVTITLAACAIVFLASTKTAHSFGKHRFTSAPLALDTGSFPSGVQTGYFVIRRPIAVVDKYDTCYWIKSSSQISLSCL